MIPTEQIDRARAVRLEDEISRRGIRLRGRNGSLEGPCPVCGGTDRFAVNTKKPAFNCRGCGIKGGDAIALIMALDGCDFMGAVATLTGEPNGHARPAQTAKRIVVERFDYHDAQGAVVYQVERVEFRNPDGSYVLKDGKHEKKFLLRRPDPDRPGEWISGPGCMAGAPRVPYRLPQLIEALAHGRRVAIVEGERKADLLWKWGIPATCNSEGYGSVKNWADHAKYFKAGDQIIVLPDNDQAGRDHASVVAANLTERGASIRVLNLPVGPKGDVIDWAATGGTREQLDDLIENTARPWTAEARPNGEDPGDNGHKPKFSRIINPANWEGLRVSDRETIVPDYIPDKTVTLFSGDGGTGKSILSLQLGVARAIAREWIGLMPKPGKTLILSCEDDSDEMWRRLDDIRKFYNASFREIGEGLRLIDNVGEDSILGMLMKGQIMPTQMYHALDEYMAEWQPSLTVIDVLADVFGGQENDRPQARQFIGLLKKLARKHASGFLLLSHPSLTGMNTGTGTSGTTGWNNSVRSRLYFQIMKDRDGNEPNKNLRTIEGMKHNYGERGGKIDLEWKNGLFVPVKGLAGFDKMAAEQKAEGVFLELLKIINKQGRRVSANPGVSYAPTVLAEEPSNQGIKKNVFADAMKRLLAKGAIKNVSFGSPSHQRSKLEIAEC
jgi:RecA-family ATPase